MRILLDECVPKRLRRLLPGHTVGTVQQLGWAGKSNGELLRAMLGHGIEVLITVDRTLPNQQNIVNSGIAVLILVAGGNRYADLAPLVPSILNALSTIKAGQVVEINAQSL